MDQGTLELAAGIVLSLAGLAPFLLAMVGTIDMGPVEALIAVVVLSVGVILIGVSERERPV